MIQNPRIPKNVVVLMGGWNAERDVSLSSGKGITQALQNLGHSVKPIEVTRDLTSLLEALTPKPDVVFNALHGRWGEDGAIQGVLEILKIPYTHSGVASSAIAMDKPFAKSILQISGLPVIKGQVLPTQEALSKQALDFPYVIKPTCEGSSVGVFMIHGLEDLKKCSFLKSYKTVMVEPYIPGRELSVAIMGNRPLGVLELHPVDGFYDYQHKYTDGKTQHFMPARIPEVSQEKLMELALQAHRALHCEGLTRTDFRYDDTKGDPGVPYILEVNTQPGMVPLSIVPEIAAHKGISFEDLVQWMIENARCPD